MSRHHPGLTATAVLTAGALACATGYGAQQSGHGAAASTGVGHTSPGRTNPGPGSATAPGRASGTHGAHAGGRSTVQPYANRANTLDAASGAPQPSWEMPRTVTPHWEIPDTNLVEPNQVQGNRRVRSAGAVGYGGFPGYFIDPYAFSGDPADESGYGQGAPPAGEDPRQQPGGPGQLPPPGQYADGGAAPSAPSAEQAQGYPSRRPPYRPGQPVQAPEASDPSDGLDHPEITLVFRDGRPAKKIRSYVLTGSALLAIENGHQTRIPLSDLDVPATEERNRAAGVDFAVPGESSQ